MRRQRDGPSRYPAWLREGVTLIPAALLAGAAAGAPAWAAPAAETLAPQEVAAVNQAIERMRDRDLDEIWVDVATLQSLSPQVAPLLLKRAEGAPERVRLGLARAACRLGEKAEGGRLLLEIARRGSSQAIRRQASYALGMVTRLFKYADIPAGLLEAIEAEADPRMKIVYAKTLWRVGKPAQAIQILKQLAAHRQRAVADEAALVLAENGQLRLVRDHLVRVFQDQTPHGERAFIVLRFDMLRQQKKPAGDEQEDSESEKAIRLLREIIGKIEDYYVDPKKADVEDMIAAAARALVGSLDPFSSYLDHDAVKAMQEKIHQTYGGIGAYVGMRNSVFTIISPIYDGPAYRVGLKSLDQVLEVDGQKTSSLKFERVIRRLKGTPGTAVKVKIYRRGWTKPQQFTIVREQIQVKSVHARLLPGNIGYVRLVQFGEKSGDELDRALEALERQGMRALVLDLRDNPGGLLSAAVAVADLFLGGEKLIVYSEGRPGVNDRRNFNASEQTTHPEIPMAVLVNSGSASASEIVSGALQDHKRAVLVGQKTYGKGSVQSIIPLHSTLYATRLRLTVAKYYLPSGRSIHEIGVEPDIKIENPDVLGWQVELVWKYHGERRFQDFVRGLWADALKESLNLLAGEDVKLREDLLDLNAFDLKAYLPGAAKKPEDGDADRKTGVEEARTARLRALALRLREEPAQAREMVRAARRAGIAGAGDEADIFALLPRIRRHYLRRYFELAESDYGQTTAYTGFDAFYRSLNVAAPDSFRDNVRREIRRMIRQRIADERGEAYVGDLQEDDQLLRAIHEMFKKTGADPTAFKVYEKLPEKFKPEAEEAAAKEDVPTEIAH